MTRQKTLLFAIALTLIGSTAGMLAHLRTSQKLGLPGVTTIPISQSDADGVKVEVVLPEQVLGLSSEIIPVDKMVLDFLPKDTSYGQRHYRASDGSFETMLNVVMMGMDRTSLHKPQFCLGGQGWVIDDSLSYKTEIPVQKPVPYNLPVMKLVTTKPKQYTAEDGSPVSGRGIYVYWFVSHEGVTASHTDRMWSMASHMLRTGTLQRWAYVSCFSVCPPGREDQTFERMKQFIAAAVPEFQLAPGSTPKGELQKL
jgi:Protein of unknown function (DUF3485)